MGRLRNQWGSSRDDYHATAKHKEQRDDYLCNQATLMVQEVRRRVQEEGVDEKVASQDAIDKYCGSWSPSEKRDIPWVLERRLREDE